MRSTFRAKIILLVNGFSSTLVCCCACLRNSGDWHFSCRKYFADPMISHRPLFAVVATRSPGEQHFSCQQYFAGPMVSHRVGTRFPPRLRWFRLGNARVGLQLTTHCSNRRPYSLIALQVAAGQMVPASGIRTDPSGLLSTRRRPYLARITAGVAFPFQVNRRNALSETRCPPRNTPSLVPTHH